MSSILQDMLDSKCSDRSYRFCGTPILLNEERARFPYRNYWHGDFEYDHPIFDHRRAGFRPRSDLAYSSPYEYDYRFPRLCFETAPNTTFPCYDRPWGQRDCLCASRYGGR